MAMTAAERQRRFRERRKREPQNRTFRTRLLQAISNDVDRMTAKSIRTGVDELRGAAPATNQVNTALPGEMFRRMAAVAAIYDMKIPEVIRISALIGLPRTLVYLARSLDLVRKQEALDQQFISEVRETNRAIDFAIQNAADPQKIEDACGRLATSLEYADSATSAEDGASRRCPGGEAV